MAKKWYTFTEASAHVGKSGSYFSVLKKKYPQYFKDVTLKKIGTNLLISEAGIEKVLEKRKSVGRPPKKEK